MEQQKRTDNSLWIAIAVGAAVLICLCIVIVIVAVALFGVGFTAFQSSTTVAFPTPVVNYAVPTSTPAAVPTPLPADPAQIAVADATEEVLRNTVIPVRDQTALAERLLGISEPPAIENDPHEVGDVIPFWVQNLDTAETLQIDAELVYRTDVVYMWVQVGEDYDPAGMQESAEHFTNSIYPTSHATFGMEPSPGIDGDPRVHVLHSDQLGASIAGYFGSSDAYPESVVQYSNEKEMFYINISNTFPGTQDYEATLTHEFQHMIHFNVDRNETSWLNEGMSEMSSFINGYGESGFVYYYMTDTNMQLTDWPEDTSTLPNYGGAYLFAQYIYDRFGEDAVAALVADPLEGMDSVSSMLESFAPGLTADDVFADWAVAIQLNDSNAVSPDGETGLFAYPSLPGLQNPTIGSTINVPYSGDEMVYQYGVDSFEVNGNGTFTLEFEGQDTTQVIPAITSGTDDASTTDDITVWWSNRGDDSNMTLTRAYDLAGLDSATLTYDLWFQIEYGWDYGYVEVSTDGGETFTILGTDYTTDYNPFGNSYGEGYTGISREQPGADLDGWLDETVDLSEYAGGEVLVRWEMVTDDAVNRPGFAIDNICIEELGECDDVENIDTSAWDSQGFVPLVNLIPQHFVVQVLIPDGSTYRVERMILDADNNGSLTFTVDGGQPALILVSGLARHTTEPAYYSLSLAQ